MDISRRYGPTETSVTTLDVILATTSGRVMSGSKRPARDPIPLGSDLWIRQLDRTVANRVMEACEPAGVEFRPTRQYGQIYSFVRTSPPNADKFQWDPDRRLCTALALSRLVRPTATGTEYSARVRIDTDGQVVQIIPGATTGPLAQAYVKDEDRGARLTKDDAEELRSLLRCFDAVSHALPPRVLRALWNHEVACCTYWSELRWTTVVTALECLVHTDRRDSTKQFTVRTVSLARKLDIDFGQADAGRAYDMRSSLVHGQGFMANPADAKLLSVMEAVLRAAVRKAIEVDGFRNMFGDNNRIQAEFGTASARLHRKRRRRARRLRKETSRTEHAE